MPAETRRDPALVAVADNYDNLGYESSAITGISATPDMGPTVMLRSHTSAGVPPVLRSMAALAKDDRLLVLPGLVYRRDAIDRIHVGAPHQVDLWAHPLGAASCWRPDGDGCLDRRDGAARGGLACCIRPAPLYRPWLPGRRRNGGTWLSWPSGLVAPHVLTRAGLDPARWSALALGMGLDRALMLRKNLPDIRLLRASDPRIASQHLLDLSPWRPVSAYSPVRRDLSLVVDAPIEAEALGDGFGPR